MNFDTDYGKLLQFLLPLGRFHPLISFVPVFCLFFFSVVPFWFLLGFSVQSLGFSCGIRPLLRHSLKGSASQIQSYRWFGASIALFEPFHSFELSCWACIASPHSFSQIIPV